LRLGLKVTTLVFLRLGGIVLFVPRRCFLGIGLGVDSEESSEVLGLLIPSPLLHLLPNLFFNQFRPRFTVRSTLCRVALFNLSANASIIVEHLIIFLTFILEMMRLNFERPFDLDLNFDFETPFDLGLPFDLDLNFDLEKPFDIDLPFDRDLNFDFETPFDLDLNFDFEPFFKRPLVFVLIRSFTIDPSLDFTTVFLPLQKLLRPLRIH